VVTFCKAMEEYAEKKPVSLDILNLGNREHLLKTVNGHSTEKHRGLNTATHLHAAAPLSVRCTSLGSRNCIQMHIKII
jgi:hypothetical protein